jgi:tetratricopeptide (TPR) repeat protein
MLAGATLGVAWPSAASAQSVDSVSNEVRQLEQRATGLDSFLTSEENVANPIPPYTQRFADAELLYRLRDYARSAVLFTDIVTNYQNTPAYGNSLYLLGESLYQAGDRLGARARFREVVGHASDPAFRPFVQRSLGRLIEIALRTGDVSGIEETFAQLNQLPPSEIEAQTTYIRGKYYFLRAQPDYDQARQAFEAVPSRAPVYPQARYFLGAILTAQGRYPEAIEAFQRVLRLQPEGPEQQQVLDLAALAIGRLEIERNNYDQAIEAYQQVGRSSPFFDRALFEQAWAFIRAGDSIRAERALEILAISNPDSPLIPEGKLLWGNLLLRTGRFDRALQVFQEVRNQFGPISQQLSQVIAQNQNPEVYFQQLIMSNIQVFDATSFLPPAALQWVRTEGTLEDSMGVVQDLNTCRTMIRESEDLIARLNAAINSPSRAHVFRDLRHAREQVFEVLNRVTQLRAEIGALMDQSSGGVSDVNLQGVQTERHGLDQAVQRLPVTDTQIRRRDHVAEGEFTTLGQELQRNEQRVQNLEAMVVAIEHYVADPGQQRGNLNIEALRTELGQHRTAIANYRERITELRRLIQAGREQIGPGDPRYERDLEISHQVHDLVQREQGIVAQSSRMPAGAAELLDRLDRVESQTLAFDQRVMTGVDRRVGGIRQQVEEEQGRVAGYRARLGQLESDASDVVGHLVMQSFAAVRLHFYQIVMRADLGIVDVAWEQREEHNNRARMLAEEENRQIAALNDEYNEVTEGAPPETPATAPGASSGPPGGASGAPSGAPAASGAPPATPAASSTPPTGQGAQP